MSKETRERVFDRLTASSQTISEVRAANVDKQPFDREWEVLRELGKRYVIRALTGNTIFQELYQVSEEQLVREWDAFVDQSLVVAKAILNDLEIDPPDEVVFDQYVNSGEHVIAAMAMTEDGKHVLSFISVELVAFFLGYIGRKNGMSFQKAAAWYDFQSILAHELRHLKQHLKYPNVSNKNQRKKYLERLSEYDARVYSLHWLRKQQPETLSERLGLWLSRAGILIEQLYPVNDLEKKIHKKFGLNEPGIVQGIRSIFTDSV